MHERTKLRKIVMGLLKGETDAKERVYDSRVIPWDADDLPGISVYTSAQRGSGYTVSPTPNFDMQLTLNIEVAVAAVDGWAEKLDDICEKVETRLLENQLFIKLFTYVPGFNTSLDYHHEGDRPIASALMSLDLAFNWFYEPTVPDDFLLMGLDVAMDTDTILKALLELKS